MKCPQCNHENVNTALTCSQCGTSLLLPNESNLVVSEGAIFLDTLVSSTDSELKPAEKIESSAEAEPVAEPEEEATEEPEPELATEPEAEASAEEEPEPEPEPAPEPEAASAPEPEPEPDPAAESAPEADSEQAPEPEPDAEPEPEAPSEPAPVADFGPIVPANPARAHQSQPPSGEALYRISCLAAAWEDIKNSDSWIKKTILLALISLVPILNFVVVGYAASWAEQLFKGSVKPMPEKLVSSNTFVNGVYGFVVSLAYSVVAVILVSLLSAMPGIGWIASMAVNFGLMTVLPLTVIRAVLAHKISAGFSFHELIETGKKNPTALACASLIPNLIFSVVAGVISLTLFIILLIPFWPYISEIGQLTSIFALNGSLQGAGPLMIFLAILLSFVLSLGSVFTYLLSYRAVGHYVARYASNWKDDAAFMANVHQKS